MAPTASPHKRRVVKHRTNAAEAGGRAAHHATGGGARRQGFQVGPKHAPDGSYLGRAKKIKSRLIENAKVKKAFYRGPGSGSSGSAPALIADAEQVATRDEGRFAPEDPVARAALADVDEVLRVREQKRARGTAAGESAAASTSAEGSRDAEGDVPGKRRRVERQKFAPPPPRSAAKGKEREERPAAAASASSDKPQRTREQAEQERRQREKKAAKTNRRGQPDLGARMELLLEKIKR